MQLEDFPLDDFAAAFTQFENHAFRLEMLPVYDVTEGDERARFQALKAGQPLPPRETTPWQDTIRAARKRGAVMERRRVVPTLPTDYIRFEVSEYYVGNQAAGENIRVLVSDAPHPFTTPVPHYQDFWLFDDKLVLLMEYNAAGQFTGVKQAPPNALNAYITLKNEALPQGLTVSDYVRVLAASPSA